MEFGKTQGPGGSASRPLSNSKWMNQRKGWNGGQAERVLLQYLKSKRKKKKTLRASLNRQGLFSKEDLGNLMERLKDWCNRRNKSLTRRLPSTRLWSSTSCPSTSNTFATWLFLLTRQTNSWSTFAMYTKWKCQKCTFFLQSFKATKK
jgi:hypothetical protein